MTKTQYKRWKDFALRMARTCFKDNANPDAKWIKAAVQDFIDGIDKDDIPCIESWDHSAPYPEGSPHRCPNRTYRCYCGYKDGVAGKSLVDCPECKGTGTATEWDAPYCMGDMMMEWEADYISNRDLMTKREEEVYDRCYCSHKDLADAIVERARERGSDPVHSCVRAALDCAVAPSMGVMGLTAGDLRRMYPKGVPAWVKGDATWETISVKAVVPGIGFVPKPKGDKHSFDSIPDDAQVWI